MNFQQIILSISGIFIIIFILVTIYSVAYSKKSGTTYVSNCPDYWEDTKYDGSACVSVHGYNTSTMNTCSGDFSGSICEKYTKVLKCPGVMWDGITYGNSQNTKNCNL